MDEIQREKFLTCGRIAILWKKRCELCDEVNPSFTGSADLQLSYEILDSAFIKAIEAEAKYLLDCEQKT